MSIEKSLPSTENDLLSLKSNWDPNELSWLDFGNCTQTDIDGLKFEWFPDNVIKRERLQSLWTRHPNRGIFFCQSFHIYRLSINIDNSMTYFYSFWYSFRLKFFVNVPFYIIYILFMSRLFLIFFACILFARRLPPSSSNQFLYGFIVASTPPGMFCFLFIITTKPFSFPP